MRIQIALSISCFLLGILGAAGGFAVQAWSGERFLEREFAGEPRPVRSKGKKEKRPPWEKTLDLTVELDPAMNPVVAGLSWTRAGGWAFRLFDPEGREVWALSGSGRIEGRREVGTADFIGPIEVATAGLHRIEFDVNRYADVSLSLRREVVEPTLAWFFSMIGLAMVGGVWCMFTVMIGSLRKHREIMAGTDSGGARS